MDDTDKLMLGVIDEHIEKYAYTNDYPQIPQELLYELGWLRARVDVLSEENRLLKEFKQIPSHVDRPDV